MDLSPLVQLSSGIENFRVLASREGHPSLGGLFCDASAFASSLLPLSDLPPILLLVTPVKPQ